MLRIHWSDDLNVHVQDYDKGYDKRDSFFDQLESVSYQFPMYNQKIILEISV